MEESEDSGSTWPQRAYPCMFCQRGFTSAQALGGHMNVHRRDRALLRQRSSQNHHASNLPGARVAEDQTASACYAPISGDRQSRLIPISRACAQSRPSRARHVKEVPLIQLFPCAVEGHGARHNFQDPMDPERQINRGGAEESKVDLELRLGLKPPD